MELFLLVVTTLSFYIYKLVPNCHAWACFLICFLGACIEKTEIMLSREHLPPTPPLHLLGGMGGGGYMGNWKYQAGCGEVGVTSTLCSTCQFAALRNGLCTKWQFCSASVRLPCFLQCTGWQFCWCQCQCLVFFAMHLAGSASDGSSVPSNTSGTVVGAKLPLLAQQHLFSDTLAQNWTAAMQSGILCSEKLKRHKAEGPRPKPLVVQ